MSEETINILLALILAIIVGFTIRDIGLFVLYSVMCAARTIAGDKLGASVAEGEARSYLRDMAYTAWFVSLYAIAHLLQGGE